MKRIQLSLALAAVLTATLVSPALAVTDDATPESQTHAHGIASAWNGTWTGRSPYTVVFYYGDGGSHNLGTVTYTSHSFSHTYWPCVTTAFTAHLDVWESLNDTPARDYVSATEAGGIC